ncbi:MAG: dTDP-4-dehydrorhamnose reductase [Tabrizicola sp.]
MKLLVFGKTGQVARELQRLAPDATYLGRKDADLLNPTTCATVINASDAQAIINAAAWTAVDKAETEEAAATTVNGDAPTAMAQAAAAKGIPFIHISTDYVFDGTGTRPFTPEDPTAPLGAYGRSKLAGETGVRAANGPHIILRTSWVFSAHGSNFVKTMLRLGRERESLRVVSDQVGGPTPASDIAGTLLLLASEMLHSAKGGTYHYSGGPDTSWADFARAIMTQANLECRIEEIPSSAYPTPARRPLNSRLDCRALLNDFGIHRPDWRPELQNILMELGQ